MSDLMNYGPQLRLLASGHNPRTRNSQHVLHDRALLLERQTPARPPTTITAWATVSTNLSVTRISLTCEEDMFFQYEADYDERGYTELKAQQRLHMAFVDFPSKLTHLLRDCADDSSRYMAVLKEDGNGCPTNTATLHFIKREMEIFHPLLSLAMVRPSLRCLKDDVTYRYNAAKRRLRVMHSFTQDCGLGAVLH